MQCNTFVKLLWQVYYNSLQKCDDRNAKPIPVGRLNINTVSLAAKLPTTLAN